MWAMRFRGLYKEVEPQYYSVHAVVKPAEDSKADCGTKREVSPPPSGSGILFRCEFLQSIIRRWVKRGKNRPEKDFLHFTSLVSTSPNPKLTFAGGEWKTLVSAYHVVSSEIRVMLFKLLM